MYKTLKKLIKHYLGKWLSFMIHKLKLDERSIWFVALFIDRATEIIGFSGF